MVARALADLQFGNPLDSHKSYDSYVIGHNHIPW